MAPSVAMVQGHASCPACVASCWWCASCPYLRRSCCLFRHSPKEVEAASSVGRDSNGKTEQNVFELAAEVQELRRVVQRLAGFMWDLGAVHVPHAAKGIKELIVDVPMQHIVEDISRSAFPSASWSRPSISQCLLVKLGLLGPERRTRSAPTSQKSHSLLVKLGLLESQSTVPPEFAFAKSSGEVGSS